MPKEKKKKIAADKLEGYTPPTGRSLTLRVEADGTQSYVEVDKASLNLPTEEEVEASRVAMEQVAEASRFATEDRVLDALEATGRLTKAERKAASDHMRSKR